MYNKINQNRINKNMSFKQNINNDPFNVMKSLYVDFCKNMKTNDLSNSPQRYITELNLINKLIEMAEEEGRNCTC